MITYLQSIQTAHSIKGDTAGLLGWYHHIRAHYNLPFNWAVFDVGAGLSVRHYSNGISQDKDVPDLLQQFSGHVVGVGQGDSFHALLVLGVEGNPFGGSLGSMQQLARRLGFSVQEPTIASASNVQLILEVIDGLDQALVLPETPGLVSFFGSKNRQCVASVAPVVAKAEAEPESEPEPDPEPEPELTPEPMTMEAPTEDKQKALITGGFRYPQNHYKPELASLGYEVVDSEGVTELPEDIKLVFYPMKSKKTKLVEQAIARGVKTMVVTELKEAIRAMKIRRGG